MNIRKKLTELSELGEFRLIEHLTGGFQLSEPVICALNGGDDYERWK